MSQPDFQQQHQQVANYGAAQMHDGQERQQNSHYYGYPPVPVSYPQQQYSSGVSVYRDQFGGQFPHYSSCPPPPTYVQWPLKDQTEQRDNFHLPPQQSLSKSEPPAPQSTSQNNMELAHLNVLQHHDIKPDPLHMSLLQLPTTQANQPQLPPPLISQLSNQSSMDSNITLWQFLLEMLTTGDHPDLIQWTNNEGEFKLIDAEAVARLWGVRKGKHQMNYDKLSRALRYYYDKNIIKKVNGQKFVYRFVVPSDSLGASADMLSYTMQRSMGIQNQSSTPNSLIAPPSTSLPRPMPTNQSIVNATAANQAYFRRSTSTTTPSIKTDSDPATTSTSRPLTVSNTTSTPSPINSTCSPGSVGSSSGVSSAGTSASNLSDVYHHAAAQANQNNTQASATSGHSSRPSSTASTATHQQSHGRKRKRDDHGMCIERIKIEPPSSYYSAGANENVFVDAQSPTNGSGLSRRNRPKPLPLDLTAVSNVNNNLTALNNANNAMNNLVAAASPLLQNSPALLNIYAATLSANLMQNQASPLSSFAAALASPHFAAAVAASPTLNPMNNNNNNSLSMFGNSLSALTTPIPTRTPQQHQNTSQSHGQFFQFPPSSQASAHFALAALLRSPGLHSPFLTAMGLGTPTAQNTSKFNMSPNDALKTPIPPLREM